MAPLQQAATFMQQMDHTKAPLPQDQGANILPYNGHGHADGSGGFSLLTFLGFLFLTLNSAMAIIRSRGETMAVVFVSFSYAVLVALFACLRMFERAPAGSARREWLKVAVWVLTTMLTLAFSSKVAAVMPAPVAALVWMMAFATCALGFVAFFVYKDKK